MDQRYLACVCCFTAANYNLCDVALIHIRGVVVVGLPIPYTYTFYYVEILEYVGQQLRQESSLTCVSTMMSVTKIK